MTVNANVAAERGVLSGICQHGSDLFLDITDLVKINTFSKDSNQVIFKCLQHICQNQTLESVDLPTVLSAANELGLSDFFERTAEAQHLHSIMQLNVNPRSVREFAGKIRRLEVARLIDDQAKVLQDKMSEVDGTEAISQILGIAENTIFDFTSMFEGEGDLEPKSIGDGIEDYVKFLKENKCDMMGISTGFPEFDRAIGGGLLPGISMVGARAKTGKTTLSVNIMKNIGEQNIPVLYLDTEMVETGKYRDISIKMLAMISGVDMDDIKTGTFGDDPEKEEAVNQAAEWLSNNPHVKRLGIAGRSFEDQLYAMRRWVQSTVGLNPDGTAKDCVIIYDYLKLMDGENLNESMREFQMLGVMMTALQSFAVRYALPILGYTQLNRDGLDGEHAGVVAGSDRITWFCTAFCIFKYKSAEEIAEDNQRLLDRGIRDRDMGNRKLVVVLSRYGAGHEFGEYCSFSMDKYKARIVEVHEEGAEGVGDFEYEEEEELNEIPFA